MKDFDVARKARKDADRAFQLGGEVFFMKAGVKPEVFAAYDDLTEETTSMDALKTIDAIVLDMIESRDEAAGRYQAIRANEEDPVTLSDLTALVEWLIGEQTGRPTQPPSPSGGGQETPIIGTPLTPVSSLPVTPAESTG